MSDNRIAFLITIAIFASTAAWIPALQSLSRVLQGKDGQRSLNRDDRSQQRHTSMYKAAGLLAVGASVSCLLF